MSRRVERNELATVTRDFAIRRAVLDDVPAIRAILAAHDEDGPVTRRRHRRALCPTPGRTRRRAGDRARRRGRRVRRGRGHRHRAAARGAVRPSGSPRSGIGRPLLVRYSGTRRDERRSPPRILVRSRCTCAPAWRRCGRSCSSRAWRHCWRHRSGRSRSSRPIPLVSPGSSATGRAPTVPPITPSGPRRPRADAFVVLESGEPMALAIRACPPGERCAGHRPAARPARRGAGAAHARGAPARGSRRRGRGLGRGPEPRPAGAPGGGLPHRRPRPVHGLGSGAGGSGPPRSQPGML